MLEVLVRYVVTENHSCLSVYHHRHQSIIHPYIHPKPTDLLSQGPTTEED